MYNRYLSISLGESSEQGLGIPLSLFDCCTASLVGVVTCNAPPRRSVRLPHLRECLPQTCPHHLNAFLINSSPLPCHLNAFLTTRRQQQPRQEKRLYIFFSLHLFFILLLSTSSHLLAKHLQLASYQHPPPDLQPASHTTLPLFGIPHRDHEVELQHARHGCRRGSGQGHAQPAPLVSQPPHSSPLRTSC
jgi:hypothetical protein